MYTRELQEKRHGPVENGVPLQGTWTEAFAEVDLLNISRPYPFPLPKSLVNLRIKEWQSFIIQNDRYFLQARLCNFKIYRAAVVSIYDKKTEERLDFRKNIPGGTWRLPRSLRNASIDSRSYGFFFRVHSWLETKTIQLELNIEQRKKRQSLTAHVIFNLAEAGTIPMVVSLLFSDRRNMYAYKALTTAAGDLVYGGQHIHFNPTETSGLFCDYKGFYPYRKYSSWVSATGFDEDGRRFGFNLGENQAKESYRNNENAFWLDGQLTPLPPVKITCEGNPGSDWIIQDMEGMVDLIFTPRATGNNKGNWLFMNREYENSLGIFNGFVLNAEGEKIPFRNVFGMGERLFLRV